MPVIGEGAARILGINLDEIKSMRRFECEMEEELFSALENIGPEKNKKETKCKN